MKGCLLANIGAETVSIVVYDHSIPISVKVFDIGSANITDDLALALRIPPEDAERLKLNKLTGEEYPEKRVQSIIQSRLKDIFALIEAHLKTLGKNQMLPAGIILAGGGAGIGEIKDIARSCLKLPSRIAQLQVPEHTQVKDSAWAVAYGLTIWGLTSEQETQTGTMVRGMGTSFTKFFKQFLP
jgi:cell division protein FtsA